MENYILAMEQLKQCPVNYTFQVIGKKFTVLIIRNMMLFGHRHFNEFLATEGINPKTLSQRLKEMKKNGIIGPKVTPGTPVTIEYYVTGKGMALRQVLDQLMLFFAAALPRAGLQGWPAKDA